MTGGRAVGVGAGGLAGADGADGAGDWSSGLARMTLANGATAYYEANIVGGESEGVAGSVVNAPTYADLPTVAANHLTLQLLSMVPEPGTSLLVMLGLGGLVMRRRRVK